MLMRTEPNCRAASGKHESGFTIVEVLISLVVLSVGLLGIAKLVLFSAHANDSAYLRSQATELAYEVLDSMRANPTAAKAGNYNTLLTDAPVNPGFSCLASPCPIASNVALYDIYQWKSRLAAPTGALPSGQGSVTLSATVPATVTITVQWDDSAAQSALAGTGLGVATPMSITLETVL
jgi:type IV pilus assembly protein PilV